MAELPRLNGIYQGPGRGAGRVYRLRPNGRAGRRVPAVRRLNFEAEHAPYDISGLVDSLQSLLDRRQIAEERFEVTLFSESALKKDWLLPEEDEAWRNL